jgi:hypothetical protein
MGASSGGARGGGIAQLPARTPQTKRKASATEDAKGPKKRSRIVPPYTAGRKRKQEVTLEKKGDTKRLKLAGVEVGVDFNGRKRTTGKGRKRHENSPSVKAMQVAAKVGKYFMGRQEVSRGEIEEKSRQEWIDFLQTSASEKSSKENYYTMMVTEGAIRWMYWQHNRPTIKDSTTTDTGNQKSLPPAIFNRHWDKFIEKTKAIIWLPRTSSHRAARQWSQATGVKLGRNCIDTPSSRTTPET